jgi:hypothetical protein
MKLFVVVALLFIVHPPLALLNVALNNEEEPREMVSPVSVELKSTVPLLCINTALFESEPPSVKVPEGSVVVPAFMESVPSTVTFVSVSVEVLVPSNRTLLNDEPFTVTTFTPDPKNRTSPLLCANAPLEISEPPTERRVLGNVGVPERMRTLLVVVAEASVIFHVPPDPLQVTS